MHSQKRSQDKDNPHNSGFLEPSTMLRLMKSQHRMDDKLTQIYHAHNSMISEQSRTIISTWTKPQISVPEKVSGLIRQLKIFRK